MSRSTRPEMPAGDNRHSAGTWLLLRGLTREAGHWGRFPQQLQAALPGARILAIDLPGNAVLAGGDVTVLTPWNSATTATLKLGDATDDDRYTSAAIDLKTAGRTALTLTSPLVMNDGQNIRLTMAYTVANATAGKVRVRVLFTIDGRVHEAITN